jgi:hypothetical protein
VTISEGNNVRAIDMRIAYDPTLLSITGATVGAVPAGATVIVNTTTPGLAIIVFFSSTALSPGSSTFVNLQADVPASSGIYGTQQVLDVHGVTISDGNDNESPVVVDDALHVTSYFAEVSGNGRINASDAAQVARFAALIDNGFAGSVNADPVILGDPSGNGRVNAADASLVAQFAALIDVPRIPAIPGGVALSGNRAALTVQTIQPVQQDDSADDGAPISDFGVVGHGPSEIYHPAIDAAIVDLERDFDRSPTADAGGALEDFLDDLLQTSDHLR